MLVVDDDASVRAMLGYVLDDEGYVVREAEDGAAALEELLTDPPDCMVLDLMMPKVDGVEVLRRRKDRSLATRTRVLVLTAKTDTRVLIEMKGCGSDEVTALLGVYNGELANL